MPHIDAVIEEHDSGRNAQHRMPGQPRCETELILLEMERDAPHQRSLDKIHDDTGQPCDREISARSGDSVLSSPWAQCLPGFECKQRERGTSSDEYAAEPGWKLMPSHDDELPNAYFE
jgi:hypothetical protein